ncbi:MAG: Na+/H+ antiporter subunit C [Anaerolineae bacterium]|nr:Na+/H+ antiporter subunit C [Anaerolineae bacterium]
MSVFLAFVIGGLYAAGFYMILRRSMVKIIFGLVLLGHAANLLIFTVGGVQRGQPPIVGDAAATLNNMADPVPQALILTAIVIGFGVQAFTIVLFKRVYRLTGTDDLDQLKSTDVTAITDESAADAVDMLKEQAQ